MALEYGRELYSTNPNTQFRVGVYDVPLYGNSGIYYSVNLLLTANLYTVMKDNWYLGIVTAYCQGYSRSCPQFVGNGQIGYGGTW